MILYKCDRCDKQKPCAQHTLDGATYDFCNDCWREISKGLVGKGRLVSTTTTDAINWYFTTPKILPDESSPADPPPIGLQEDQGTSRPRRAIKVVPQSAFLTFNPVSYTLASYYPPETNYGIGYPFGSPENGS